MSQMFIKHVLGFGGNHDGYFGTLKDTMAQLNTRQIDTAYAYATLDQGCLTPQEIRDK